MTFKCQICKKEFDDDSEDWGNMCFRCADCYNDAMLEQREENEWKIVKK